MKAITIQQPWASLVVMGVKEYETRAWKLIKPIQYRKPLPCKGQLSLWDVPDDVLEKIRAFNG